MAEDLPSEFDLIVVGTGLSESIIAAAASRIGKNVLHVDSNDCYGGLWTSFNLEGIQKLSKHDNETAQLEYPNLTVKENELKVEIENSGSIEDMRETWYLPERVVSNETVNDPQNESIENENVEENPVINNEAYQEQVSPQVKWSREEIMKNYRKFNLDLAPKVLFARGSLVELLISSNIARYAEFRNVSRILTWTEQYGLQDVPCSRADVFSTRQVTVIEKRMLMKLLTDLMDEQKTWDFDQNYTFVEFLSSYNLTPITTSYVLHAMTGGTETMLFKEGFERTRKFLQSIGRYGNTPFLWTMYGTGELPQCFCRLCAVFGGTYCLNRPIHSTIISDETCTGIGIGNQIISASKIVMAVDSVPTVYLPNPNQVKKISRAIFIISKSIKEMGKEHLTLLRLPPIDGYKPCTILEVGTAAGVCPKNLYVLYMYTEYQNNPQQDLSPYVNILLNTNIIDQFEVETDSADTKPQVFWSLYFTVKDYSNEDLNTGIPKNLYICAGPDLEIDFDFGVKQAKDIFMEIYPNEEFLPRAPDPEEIVLEGEDENENNEVNEQVPEALQNHVEHFEENENH